MGRGRNILLSELTKAYVEDAVLSFRYGAWNGGQACEENVAHAGNGVRAMGSMR